jgi:hypothetical protein
MTNRPNSPDQKSRNGVIAAPSRMISPLTFAF